jgi:hypothetical protein
MGDVDMDMDVDVGEVLLGGVYDTMVSLFLFI